MGWQPADKLVLESDVLGYLFLLSSSFANTWLTGKQVNLVVWRPTKDIECLSNKDNPLYPINNLYLLLKQFIRKHGAYGKQHRKYRLNQFWFILNKTKHKQNTVLKFIEMAVSSPKKEYLKLDRDKSTFKSHRDFNLTTISQLNLITAYQRMFFVWKVIKLRL